VVMGEPDTGSMIQIFKYAIPFDCEREPPMRAVDCERDPPTRALDCERDPPMRALLTNLGLLVLCILEERVIPLLR
jgi:hypothetical protein